MSNPHMTLADGGPDDLPRTLRREKEAREREARERSAAAMAPVTAPPTYQPAEMPAHAWTDDAQPAVVTALQIPFFRLVAFFFKAVFAAIPALILLGGLLWVAGAGLKYYFPKLVHTEITIKVPR